MGGSISKRQSRVSRTQRIEYLKKTPFFLYLHGDNFEEFASCFSMTRNIRANETLAIDKEVVYIVAEGELELRTTLPVANSKMENSGYLCKKAVGDIVSKPQAQIQAARKVRGIIWENVRNLKVTNGSTSPFSFLLKAESWSHMLKSLRRLLAQKARFCTVTKSV